MRKLFVLFSIAICTSATVVPPLSLEELVSKSDQIITGKVIDSSYSWGVDHKFIWTYYEIEVVDTWKGAPEKAVTVSEPGGALDGQAMRVAGAVRYTVGEQVTLFLQRFPSGTKRTVGWAQGKFEVDGSGRVHPSTSVGFALLIPGTSQSPTALASLDGITTAQLRDQIRAIQKNGVSR